MTHQIRRVVTGHDEKGRAVVISDGPAPVRARQQARTGLVYSGHLAHSRDAGQDRCKPPSARPGWAGPRSSGGWDRCPGRWSAEFWSRKA
jgi:hypothetical protein